MSRRDQDEENFYLTYDSDEENKARKLLKVSSMAQSMKVKNTGKSVPAMTALEESASDANHSSHSDS